jgi:hypothetical protein
MPETMNSLTRKLNWSKKQTSYAWGKYYEQCRERQVSSIEAYQVVSNVPVEELPTHLQNEMREYIKKLKIDIECPICLDVINPDNLEITRCGHKYCKTCFNTLKTTTKKCAVCRKTICK